MSEVRVVVIDWTETGASPPTATDPTCSVRLALRSAIFSGTDGIPSETAVIWRQPLLYGSWPPPDEARATEITAPAPRAAAGPGVVTGSVDKPAPDVYPTAPRVRGMRAAGAERARTPWCAPRSAARVSP
ncbi:hypothetical protein GCM10010400_31780 [Streptomyces aculeolatus]